MITFDTTALLKSLQDAHADAKRRLEQMVRGFTYEVSLRAIENTPLGNAEVYARYYRARVDLPQEEGIARGNWQFGLDDSFNLQLISGQDSGVEASNLIKSTSASYRLGATFYIANAAPYISDLEADKSYQTNGQGIMQPTIADITGAYAVDFQYHYAK